MGTSRALRVALIQAGRIVEDRTFTDRTKITVGTGEKSTFLVPMAEVPVTTPVFDIGKHGTSLLFDSNTEGRVTIEGAEAPLSKFVDRAAQKGKQLALQLPDDAKGRVSIGEVSLLFQFVDPPKRPTPAPLPKGAKGLVAQLDRSFLAILALSLAAHFAGIGYISKQPLPVEQDLSIEEMIPDRFARALLPLPKPNKPPEVVKAPDQAPVAEPPKTPKQPSSEVSPPKVAGRPTGDALKRRLKDMGMLAVIGANGTGESNLGDLMKDTGATSVADAMRGMQPGMKVATVEDATASQRRGEDTGDTEDIERIGTDGVKRVELTETGPRKPGKPEVKTEKLVVEKTPEIDEKELARWLNSRKPAIQNCYEQQLKRNPTLKGRISINFTITPRGRIGAVDFDQDTLGSKAVNTCISGMMRGWVLPFEPEDDVPATLPFIFAPGN